MLGSQKLSHDVSAKIDLFKETCHKFLSKINDPKIVTERLKKDIIKLVIDEVVIEGESVKIFATIPLPNKIQEREMDKTDIPGTFNAGATLGPINETNMTRIWNKHKQTNTPLKRKVFVGMSGGVDSSVAAMLLRDQGHDVVGVFMRSYNLDGCADKDAEDARRVAEHLKIPFYIWDFEEEYKRLVVDYMIQGYRAGITPNPDIMCNKEIKFGLFLKKAIAAGADLIATGHYVSLIKKSDGSHSLLMAKDKNKDQSYFLWTLKKEHLSHCLFPVGDYLKSEIRQIARKAGIPTAEKKDSRGICFLGKISLADFLKEYIPERQGDLVTTSGKRIGKHSGMEFYTIGQRHLDAEFEFPKTGTSLERKPFYVSAKDSATNTVILAEGAENPALYSKNVSLLGVNLMEEVSDGATILARVRYRQKLFQAHLTKGAGYRLEFETPQKFIAPGQSAVFYREDGTVLGGGIIA